MKTKKSMAKKVVKKFSLALIVEVMAAVIVGALALHFSGVLESEPEIIKVEEPEEIFIEPSCLDLHLSREFRKILGNVMIENYRKDCFSKSGVWTELSGEVSCNFNRAYALDCGGDPNLLNIKTICGELDSKFICDGKKGFLGCVCN